jgi:hypothetical protein
LCNGVGENMNLSKEEKEYIRRIRLISSETNDLFCTTKKLKAVYQEIEDNPRARLIFYMKRYHSFREKVFKLMRELFQSIVFALILYGIMDVGAKGNSVLSKNIIVAIFIVISVFLFIIPYAKMFFNESDIRTIFIRNIEKQIIKDILRRKFEIDYEDTE